MQFLSTINKKLIKQKKQFEQFALISLRCIQTDSTLYIQSLFLIIPTFAIRKYHDFEMYMQLFYLEVKVRQGLIATGNFLSEPGNILEHVLS